MEFSQDIKDLIQNELGGKDYTKMSLEELKQFRTEVVDKRHEYSLIEKANKTLGNAAYGACASPYFYFFNPSLAEDITGECRKLTTTFWNGWPEYFHETIWKDKELQKKFDFELDESKHEWYRQQTITIYADTDSVAKNTILSLKDKQITIEDLYKNCFNKSGLINTLDNGQEIVSGNDNYVLNWTKEKGLNYVPIKYVIRHKVTKPKFKIKTKSGKIINVTGDHSCIVFREGKQLTIKAKDINPKTDKILVVKDNG